MNRQAIERAEKTLQRMLEWIARHDARSAAVLGITVAMLGALPSSLPPAESWTGPMVVTVLLASGCLGLVLVEILRGQFPRLRTDRPSILFFGTVADLSMDEFRSRFAALDDGAYLDDLLRQCHVNARILRIKFRTFQRSVVFLLVAAFPWAMALGLARAVR